MTPQLDIEWAKVRSLVAEVMDELAPQLPAMADEVARDMHERVPQLQRDTAMLAYTRASCLATFRLMVGLAREGRDLGLTTPPHEAFAFVRELVQRAVPFQALVSSYGIGHSRLAEASLAVLHRRLCEPEVVVEAALVLNRQYFGYVHMALKALDSAYSVEQTRWIRNARAVRCETVRSLLDGDLVDAELASRRLGYALNQRHQAFVVWVTHPGDDNESVDAALERIAHEFVQHTGCARHLLVPLGRRVVAGWIAAVDKTVENASWSVPQPGGTVIQVATGSPASGLSGFRRSHFDAQHARRVVDLCGDTASQPWCYDQLALQSLLTLDVERARQFMKDELGELATPVDANLPLIGTLIAYFEEECRPLATARRLGVHKNTVLYRIARAEKLRGRSLAVRSLELRVALLLAQTLTPTSRA